MTVAVALIAYAAVVAVACRFMGQSKESAQ
jgi:hypothetical protein